MQEIAYVGNELELFQHATVWKNYFGSILKPYIGKNVLEAGAGIGSTTQHLCNGTQDKWTCLEPDPELFSELQNKVITGRLPSCCIALKGIIQDLPVAPVYDTILYIDVIEHIEEDAKELSAAKERLSPGGHLIILVPAHQFVFSPFDASIGHYRRYNKKMLKSVIPSGFIQKKLRYLDALGLLASVVNKFILKQKYPTLKQINMWDKKLLPVSKLIDPVIGYSTGKTLIGIWQKK